jgi:hypothetical protein
VDDPSSSMAQMAPKVLVTEGVTLLEFSKTPQSSKAQAAPALLALVTLIVT